MSLRKNLLQLTWGMQRLIVPKLKYSQDIYEETLGRVLQPHFRWLELGCGHQILPSWRGRQEVELVERCREVVGLDGDLTSLRTHRTITRRVLGDIASLPFASSTFELVTANMVVEHLGSPEKGFREVNRVLQVGGILLLITPNAFGYPVIIGRLVPFRLKQKLVRVVEARAEADIFATFYKANTTRRLQELALKTGFEVASLKLILTSPAFGTIPPLALLELIWIRALMSRSLRAFRHCIIAVLTKTNDVPGQG